MARITWQNVNEKLPSNLVQYAPSVDRMLGTGIRGIGTSLEDLANHRSKKEEKILSDAARASAEAMMLGTYDSDQARRAILDQVKDTKRRDAILAALKNVPAEFQTATAEGTDAAGKYISGTYINAELDKRQRLLNNDVNADRFTRLWAESSAIKEKGYGSPIQAVFEKFNYNDADPKTQTAHQDMANVTEIYNTLVERVEGLNGGRSPIPEEMIASVMIDSLSDLNFFGDGRIKNWDKAKFNMDAAMKVLKRFDSEEKLIKFEMERQRYESRQATIDNQRGRLGEFNLRLSIAETRGDKEEIARIQKNIDTLGLHLGGNAGSEANDIDVAKTYIQANNPDHHPPALAPDSPEPTQEEVDAEKRLGNITDALNKNPGVPEVTIIDKNGEEEVIDQGDVSGTVLPQHEYWPRSLVSQPEVPEDPPVINPPAKVDNSINEKLRKMFIKAVLPGGFIPYHTPTPKLPTLQLNTVLPQVKNPQIQPEEAAEIENFLRQFSPQTGPR